MPVSLATQHHNKIHSPAGRHMALLQEVLRHSERISTAPRDEVPLQLCVEWLESESSPTPAHCGLAEEFAQRMFYVLNISP